MPAFTPPPLNSYEGPAQGFTPPPVSSHEGPAEQPGFWGSFLGTVNPVNMAKGVYHAVTQPFDQEAMGDQFKRDSGLIDGSIKPAPMPPPAAVAGELAGMATIAGVTKAIPAIGGLLSKGATKIAVPVAESSLGVRAIQRGYGKTPGLAALEETKGIRPGTVAASARDRVGLLNTELENRAAASTTPGSLQPAIDAIDQRAATAAGGNSSYTPAELERMRAHLTDPQPGFNGVIDPATGKIATDQSATNILRMKREFGKDFTKWNPLNPSGEMGTARKVYGLLDSELDRTVPGADKLNQRIASLIPVAERGEATELNAGVTQNVMHRAAAHTGAALSGVAGYHYGGPLGAAAGMVLPEIAASPEARMALARSLYGTGKFLGNTPAQRTAQAALLSGGVLGIQNQKKGGLLY